MEIGPCAAYVGCWALDQVRVCVCGCVRVCVGGGYGCWVCVTVACEGKVKGKCACVRVCDANPDNNCYSYTDTHTNRVKLYV